ncbi:MAG: HD domain-containing protein [Burkholderiales bacterium]
MKQYRTLYNLVGRDPNDPGSVRLSKALRILTDSYREVLSPSGHPYVKDLLEVAIILAGRFSIGLSPIIATLLQDTINDHKITESELREAFGNQTTDIVLTLMQLKAPHQPHPVTDTLSFKPLLSNFSKINLMVVLIKIAEYIHSMRILDAVPTSSQAKIIDEIKHIYIPLVHRLGLNEVQLELEDLQFKFQNKAIYDTICHKIRTTKATEDGFLESFIAPIHAIMRKEFPQYTIKARTKTISSIWHKIESRNIPFEEIHDLYAIRVVFDSEPSKEHSNCWLIYELLTTLYEPRLDRLRDWLTYPKDSGYEALHIAVLSPQQQWVEIQIRTTRMDAKAEHGHAAHWKYKDHTLSPELANISSAWFDEAQDVLHQKWYKSKKMLDINIDPLYIQPNS